jgi:hypothetical protein
MVQISDDIVNVWKIALDMEIRRSVEFINEQTAECGLIVVDDYDLHIFHIETERIAKKKNENNGKQKSKIQASKVPENVIKFFAGNCLNLFDAHVFLLAIK